MILGTAGHIDHGKTTLVRALTGVDTDRLPEEKRRGITIELGFAPLDLPGAGMIGVVDVPGHEAFVRTMLAGATGIDVALVVIAADEGVMPQTTEHLAILSLLGVRAGVVALTKRELVDDDWLALVADDVRSTLAAGPLGDAPVIAVSALTGEGLDALRDALRDAASRVPERDEHDLFRMPIDRAFTVKGTGTVVTGTVWSGALDADASVRILPAGLAARVRGIQSHGAAVPRATPGRRVALSLAGIERDDVERGGWIVADPRWATTTVLRADVALLDGAPSLGPRSRVRFHLGTQDVGARVVARGGALASGAARPVRIVCDAPVLARGGDRFVLRSASPATTIGGGIVTDPLPGVHRARPSAVLLPTVEARVAAMVAEGDEQGVDLAAVPQRAGVSPSTVRSMLASLAPEVLIVGDRVVSAAAFERIRQSAKSVIDRHHTLHPLEEGAPLHAVRSAGGGATATILEAALASLAGDGAIVIEGSTARRAGWSATLADDDARLADLVLAALAAGGSEPPSVDELSSSLGRDVTPVLRYLERAGRVTPVEPGRYYARDSLARLVDRLRGGMTSGKEYGPAELRDLLGFSRKFLIPFLEYCDRTGLTERRSGGRVRVGT